MTIGKLSGQCDFGQKGQSYCNQRGQSCVAKRVKVAWLFQYSFIRYFSYANVRIKTEIKKQTRNKNVPKKNQLTENSENN